MRQRSREGSNINFKSTCAPGSQTRRLVTPALIPLNLRVCLSTKPGHQPVPPPRPAPRAARAAAARHLFGPPPARAPPCGQIKGKLQTEPLLAPQGVELRNHGLSLLSPRSAPRCRVGAVQHPSSAQVSLLLLEPLGFCSPHPSVASTPLALYMSCVPGLQKSFSRSWSLRSLSLVLHKLPRGP